MVAGRVKLGNDIRVATFHSALAPTPCSFTIHPSNARSVVVHLDALDLEDIVLLGWPTTPATAICPVVPARSGQHTVSGLINDHLTYQTILPGTFGTFLLNSPTYFPST